MNNNIEFEIVAEIKLTKTSSSKNYPIFILILVFPGS